MKHTDSNGFLQQFLVVQVLQGYQCLLEDPIKRESEWYFVYCTCHCHPPLHTSNVLYINYVYKVIMIHI